MKRRMLCVMTGVVPLMVVGIYICHLDLSTLKGHRSSYTVMTDSGVPLESLFDGARAAGFKVSPFRSTTWHRAVKGKCGSQGATGVLSALLRLFEVPSVYAAVCTNSQCGGSYASLSAIACGSNCSANDLSVAGSMGSDPGTGWHYTGDCGCPADDGSGCCDCQQGLCSI
jgi:hypothetical protein